MFFDAAAASSLLALFVSTGNNFNIDINVNEYNVNEYNGNGNGNSHVQTDLRSGRTPSVVRLRNRIPTTRNFPPSCTALSGASGMNTNTNTNMNNPMVPTAVPLEKYAALLEWLSSNGAIVNGCLDVRPSSLGNIGYGVFVKSELDKPIEEGELLFSIPRNLCVTIEKATLSDDDDGVFGEGLSNLVEKAGPGGSTVAMAGYMAKEYILMYLEERDLQIAKENGDNSQNNSIDNNDNNNDNNRWGPYMELMPWKRGINNQEHVLFWNEAKIEELLGGSLCYTEARTLRREVALSIQVLGPLLKRSVRMARGDLSNNPLERLASMLPWQRYQQQQNPDNDLEQVLDDRLIGDAIKGAFVTLLTRSFADENDEASASTAVAVANASGGEDDEDEDAYSEKLVPLLDLLQHSDTPNVRHSVNNGNVEVRARASIEPGSELWNQYRSEEDEAMPYSRFFTRFGFVPGIDEPIENLLLDKSPIFYPQKAEV